MSELMMQEPPRLGRRQNKAAMVERMRKHHRIYNAACLLRDAWGYHDAGSGRRLNCAKALGDAVLEALREPHHDIEAILYALADSLTCSPLGTPWE